MKYNSIERARRYLAGMPPAIAGSGGDLATFKAAGALVKGFNLTTAEALPLLREWNASCVPPWPESTLRGKLDSAARSSKPGGYLLAGKTTIPARTLFGLRFSKERASCPPVPDKAAEKAAKRAEWPKFKTPSAEDIQRIAELRGVTVRAARVLVTMEYLWRCRWKGEDCFAIREGSHFAQVRRMDGLPFEWPDGSFKKTLNLPGSEGAFLNPCGFGGAKEQVILTEGAVSLLEVAEVMCRADDPAKPVRRVTVLAALSVSSRFSAELLQKLAGRRVRIIPDTDPAGLAAADSWAAALRERACSVDCIKLPAGCKDLGDALNLIPAGDSYWRQLLTF